MLAGDRAVLLHDLSRPSVAAAKMLVGGAPRPHVHAVGPGTAFVSCVAIFFSGDQVFALPLILNV